MQFLQHNMATIHTVIWFIWLEFNAVSVHVGCVTYKQTHRDKFPTSMYVYIGLKTFFYLVRHLDSIASYLPTSLHLGFFRSWPSLFLPSSFSSVFHVLSFVLASTSMLFWAVFLLSLFEHGRTM